VDDDEGVAAALPSRYALEPVERRATDNPGHGHGRSTRASLPHVLSGPPPLSRRDAHLLSRWRRDELRQIREEDDRRGRLAIILSVGLLRVGVSTSRRNI